MNDKTQTKWDSYYAQASDVPAMRVVAENLHLLPETGRGLELACGLAANAFLLAQHGIEMAAWDISPVAIERVNALATQKELAVTGLACDVVANPPAAGFYDVVVVSHFLDRSLVNAIQAALKPGGLLFYQTFTQTRVSQSGPDRNEWRLADGELLTLFAPFQVLVYREEGLEGNVAQGFRNEALLIARKV